jgi:hypothetical protein
LLLFQMWILRVDDQHAGCVPGAGACLRGGLGGCGRERHDEAPPRHEAASQHGVFEVMTSPCVLVGCIG